MEPIFILVGTISGTADMVAGELLTRLRKSGRAATQIDMDRCGPNTLKPDNLYIICSSTYGTGNVPDNAQKFYDYLTGQKPDLNGIRYGVVGLGDRLYDSTFCNGGKSFDAILSSLGAVRIGERMEHDASSGRHPDEQALEWLDGWLPLCAEATTL